MPSLAPSLDFFVPLVLLPQLNQGFSWVISVHDLIGWALNCGELGELRHVHVHTKLDGPCVFSWAVGDVNEGIPRLVRREG